MKFVRVKLNNVNTFEVDKHILEEPESILRYMGFLLSNQDLKNKADKELDIFIKRYPNIKITSELKPYNDLTDINIYNGNDIKVSIGFDIDHFSNNFEQHLKDDDFTFYHPE